MAQQPEEQREETLGQRIRAKREERDWSREKLADELGVVSLSILRWELDRSFPRGDDVQQGLIEVLGLPKNEFAKWEKKKRAKKLEERAPGEKREEDEGASPMEKLEEKAKSAKGEEAEKDERAFSVEMILPYEYWHVPLPSDEEGTEKGIVEYRVPPIMVYRGFYEPVFYEKYGYVQERRVTSKGKPLLPYETWVNPKTVPYGWGHTGAGPRHLAESMLLDYFEVLYPNEQEKVLRLCVQKYSYNFKMDFTAWFEKKEWEIWSGAITAWLQEERENGDPAPEHTLMDIEDGWTGWLYRWDKYKGT